MAAQTLFDISAIDLTQVAITPEAVAGMNPQTGHMRHLDYVIWKSEDSTSGLGVKAVHGDEFWVDGHIPGRPLMPGVLMIEAAAQLCSLLHKCAHPVAGSKFLGFTRCDEVAFRGQVIPGATLYLLARELSFRPRRFVSAAQAIVDNRLVFEATITGMVL